MCYFAESRNSSENFVVVPYQGESLFYQLVITVLLVIVFKDDDHDSDHHNDIEDDEDDTESFVSAVEGNNS